MKHRWTTSLSLILTRGLSTLFSLSPDRLPSRRGGHPSRSTASAAGRPAGRARLAGARRGLVRSARVLAAVAWLSLLGALALPAPAQAQTTGICDRTQQVHEAIVSGLSGVDDCAAVTDADLAGITDLTSLEFKNIDSLKSGDFAGLTSLTALGLAGNSITMLPADVFSGLTALTNLGLNNNDLESLPADVFSGLTSLTVLKLGLNSITMLPADVFSGLTALTNLSLSRNALNALPDGLFSGLTALETLSLDGNSTDPLPLTVTVEKVGTDGVRAKVLAGAPFAVDIPVTLVDGTLAGGATTLRVEAGAVEGEPLTVTRTVGPAGDHPAGRDHAAHG